MSRIEEIEIRLKDIKGLMLAEDADIDALSEETDKLIEERKSIMDEEQKRTDLLQKVADGEGTIVKEIPAMEDVRTYGVETAEYRKAWLNSVRNLELSDVERRALTTTNGAIAKVTADKIIEKVKELAPILDKMTVIYTGAQVTFYAEGTNTAATIHTEGGAVTPAADTMVPITLTPARILKQLKITGDLMAMSIDAFEAWVVRYLAEAIAKKVNEIIVTELESKATSAGTSYSATNLQKLMGAVNGDVVLICNRATLFNKIMPLMDASKSPIVTFVNGNAFVYGAPVLIDENASANTTVATDLSKVVAAMAEGIEVRGGYNVGDDDYAYNGIAQFACSADGAVVGKLTATA